MTIVLEFIQQSCAEMKKKYYFFFKKM